MGKPIFEVVVGSLFLAVTYAPTSAMAASAPTATLAGFAAAHGALAAVAVEHVAAPDRGGGIRGSRPPGLSPRPSPRLSPGSSSGVSPGIQHRPGSSRSAPAPYRGSGALNQRSRSHPSTSLREERAYQPPASYDRSSRDRRARGRSVGSDVSCDWLYRRAITTGDRYWWTRYRSCVSAY